jgi:hypothetical protein
VDLVVRNQRGKRVVSGGERGNNDIGFHDFFSSVVCPKQDVDVHWCKTLGGSWPYGVHNKALPLTEFGIENAAPPPSISLC